MYNPTDPTEADCDPHPLSEQVLQILEEAGVDTEVNDAVVDVIEKWFLSQIHRCD